MIKSKKILLMMLLFGSHVIFSMNRSEALRILRLDDNVSDKGVITRAYRDLALQYHPDKNIEATDDKKKEAAENFKKVQEAYEFLIKPAASTNDLMNAKEEKARQMVKDLLEDYTSNAGQLVRGLNFYIKQYVTKESLRDENPNFIDFLIEKKTGFDALLNAGSIDKETFITEINNLLEAKRQEQNATGNTANEQRKQEEERLRREQMHQQYAKLEQEEEIRKQLEAEMNHEEEMLREQFQREKAEISRRDIESKNARIELEREEKKARKDIENEEAKFFREMKKEMNRGYDEIAKREKIEETKRYINNEYDFFNVNNLLSSNLQNLPREIRLVIIYENRVKFLNALYDHILKDTNYDKDVAQSEIDILLEKIKHQKDDELRIIKDQENRGPLMEALKYAHSLS